MAKYSDDWDAVSGLGRTALATAAGRAIETTRTNGLVNDPFAKQFVVEAKSPTPMPTELADPVDRTSEFDRRWDIISMAVGVRTRFFDQHLLEASRTGCEQAVILAAGLDTRAYRLELPPGTKLFEVDKPGVHEFKQRVLNGLRANPLCDRRTVSCDLRDDWIEPLAAAGFEPGRPTCWLIEGLTAYLTGDEETRLFKSLHDVSTSGSYLGFDHPADPDELRRDTYQANSQYGFDLAALLVTDSAKDPVGYLRSIGWEVATTGPAKDATLYCGRHNPYGSRDLAHKWLFSRAVLRG
ncbi:SAM-dependent methyltransferase [Amycolatopsis thermoflava]|uniref:SAM-dependent methyltransferase n=1 Tax=Amycolatopsis thermoflava TaxID=84480 RepID=UPI0003FCF926|nr:SAM-dependent methyltransferase [Amycolatopsis thermoflava]